jgi:hypothetical protein
MYLRVKRKIRKGFKAIRRIKIKKKYKVKTALDIVKEFHDDEKNCHFTFNQQEIRSCIHNNKYSLVVSFKNSLFNSDSARLTIFPI